MSEGWERLGRRRGGRGGCLLGACLDTTVLSRSPILALFLPFQNAKDQSFHSRNGHRTERSCFYQTELSKEGWFVASFFVSFHVWCFICFVSSVWWQRVCNPSWVKELLLWATDGGWTDKWMGVGLRNEWTLGEIGKAGGGLGGCFLRRGELVIFFGSVQARRFICFISVVWGGLGGEFDFFLRFPCK